MDTKCEACFFIFLSYEYDKNFAKTISVIPLRQKYGHYDTFVNIFMK